MSDRDKGTAEDDKTGAAPPLAKSRRLSRNDRLIAGASHNAAQRIALADTVAQIFTEILSEREKAVDLSFVGSNNRLTMLQVKHTEPDPQEVEMQALMNSIDERLVEIHQRIDRVLAQRDNG